MNINFQFSFGFNSKIWGTKLRRLTKTRNLGKGTIIVKIFVVVVVCIVIILREQHICVDLKKNEWLLVVKLFFLFNWNQQQKKKVEKVKNFFYVFKH